MSKYFLEPYEPFGWDLNVTIDLSNYATRADIKNIPRVDTSNFALKTNLANLKTKVDKLDLDKLNTCFSWFKETKWCSEKWCC